MFSNTTKLASGKGTIALHAEMGLQIITIWTEETDRFTVVHTIPTVGCDIDAGIRARKAAQAWIKEYAAAN